MAFSASPNRGMRSWNEDLVCSEYGNDKCEPVHEVNTQGWSVWRLRISERPSTIIDQYTVVALCAIDKCYFATRYKFSSLQDVWFKWTKYNHHAMHMSTWIEHNKATMQITATRQKSLWSQPIVIYVSFRLNKRNTSWRSMRWLRTSDRSTTVTTRTRWNRCIQLNTMVPSCKLQQ